MHFVLALNTNTLTLATLTLLAAAFFRLCSYDDEGKRVAIALALAQDLEIVDDLVP